ncbi:MAG: hypothetical protein ACXAD7_00725 [Candidatus Kariarchaeaceae archaeon]|jgi:hypothetical protein
MSFIQGENKVPAYLSYGGVLCVLLTLILPVTKFDMLGVTEDAKANDVLSGMGMALVFISLALLALVAYFITTKGIAHKAIVIVAVVLSILPIAVIGTYDGGGEIDLSEFFTPAIGYYTYIIGLILSIAATFMAKE